MDDNKNVEVSQGSFLYGENAEESPKELLSVYGQPIVPPPNELTYVSEIHETAPETREIISQTDKEHSNTVEMIPELVSGKEELAAESGGIELPEQEIISNTEESQAGLAQSVPEIRENLLDKEELVAESEGVGLPANGQPVHVIQPPSNTVQNQPFGNMAQPYNQPINNQVPNGQMGNVVPPYNQPINNQMPNGQMGNVVPPYNQPINNQMPNGQMGNAVPPYNQPINNQMPNGQPGNAVPPYGPGYMPMPPLNQNPKKNKSGVVIGIVAAVSGLLIILLCVMIFRMLFRRSNPSELIRQGVTYMQEEMEAYTSAISDDIDFEALYDRMKKETYHANIDWSFSVADTDVFSVEADMISDYKKQAVIEMYMGMYGFEMKVADFAMDETTFYFSSPVILGKDTYYVDLENLGTDFNNSGWSEFLGIELPEDTSYILSDTSEVSSIYDKEMEELFQKYSDTLASATQYEMLTSKKDFQIDGRTVSCRGVTRIVAQDAFNQAMETLNKDIQNSVFYRNFLTGMLEGYASYDGDLEELKEESDKFLEDILSIRLEQDYVVNYYLDDKGRIVNISTPNDIRVSGKNNLKLFSIDISFLGKERRLDEITGGIYFQAGEELLYFGMERSASVTRDLYSENLSFFLQDNSHTSDITFRYWNDWSYTDKTYDMRISLDTKDVSAALSASGGYSNIVRGQEYLFELDNAVLNIDGEDLLIMRGKLKIEPSDELIELPKDAIDCLKMSEEDIWNVMYDIQ